MKISPLDIKKQEFARSLRGYDLEEVQAFLDMLAGQWEEMLADQRRADDKVRELQDKLEHYRRVEEALQEALHTAREGSKQALENAKQEAALIVKKAVGEAEDLTRSALLQRDVLLQEVDQLNGRRDEIVARLRAFLLSEVEILSHFEEREWPGAERPKPEVAAVDPTLTTGPALLPALGPVVGDREAKTGRLPELEALEPAPAAPFDLDGLEAVLQDVTATEPAAEVEPAAEAAAAEPVDIVVEEMAVEEIGADQEIVAEEETASAEAAEMVDEEIVAEEMVAEEVVQEETPVEAAVAEEPLAEEMVAEEEAPVDAAVDEEETPVEASDEPFAEAPIEIEVEGPTEEAAATHEAAAQDAAAQDAAALEPFYVEEEPLHFKFFEPNDQGGVSFFEEAAAERDVRFAPGAEMTRRHDDRPPMDDTWIVRPAASPEKTSVKQGAAKDDLTASSEEIEKIRRILNDLD